MLYSDVCTAMVVIDKLNVILQKVNSHILDFFTGLACQNV